MLLCEWFNYNVVSIIIKRKILSQWNCRWKKICIDDLSTDGWLFRPNAECISFKIVLMEYRRVYVCECIQNIQKIKS